MSRYKAGDVVRAHFAFFDKNEGRFVSKPRPFVIVDIDDAGENITVSCTSQTHQSKKYPGILVAANSNDGKQMGIDKDSFVYCDQTISLSNRDIIRKIGTCPLISQILNKLGYSPDL